MVPFSFVIRILAFFALIPFAFVGIIFIYAIVSILTSIFINLLKWLFAIFLAIFDR